MSLRNIVEVVIQLDSFRNIDLFKRGLYYYQFTVSHLQDGHEIFASPYNCYTQDSLLPKHFNNAPGVIEDLCFKSKTFYIKFCDEDVDIKEIVAFRTEIELLSGQVPDILISCKLFYLETDEKTVFSASVPMEFSEECSITIRVSSYTDGVSQFLPILFDSSHFCVLNATVHVLPIDFRFRPRPLLEPVSSSTVTLDLYSSLAEAFFPGSSRLTPETAKLAQSRYVQSLHRVYQKLTQLIHDWIEYAENDNRLAAGQVLPSSLPEVELVAEPLATEDPVLAAQQLFAQVQKAAEHMHALAYCLLSSLLQIPAQVCGFLTLRYNRLVFEKWGESVFRTVSVTSHFSCIANSVPAQLREELPQRIRRSEYFNRLENTQVCIDNFFPPAALAPILFLDVSSKVPEEKIPWQDDWIKYSRCSNGFHLVVFVHGFQGNSFDMRAIRSQVALLRSNAMLMCAGKNEGMTSDDIFTQGKRLAAEVHQFIDDWCTVIKPAKISFIGHSMGGLVIRAALPLMQDLADKFCFYMSLSTPHLGYAYKSSALVGAGMWVLKKFKKSQSIREMTMTDAEQAEETFLYRLSKFEGMEWFKHIALVASMQDEYAPYESARIEVAREAEDKKKGRVMIEMGENIMARVRANKIHRINVDFKIEKSGFDKMIGRAAHIQMLENGIAINMILHCCASFFEL